MKLAMIIEAWKPLWGGGQAVAYNLAKYLSEDENCKIDLYVMNLIGKPHDYIESINNNFNIIYTGKKRNFSFMNRLLWIYELINLVKINHKKEKYNYIYAHANLPGIPAIILSKQLTIPNIYHVHGSGIEAMKKMYGDNFKSKFLFYVENYIQTKIKYDLQITVDKLFLKRKNINNPVFIPNGVDIKLFTNKENIQKENKKGLNFIFVGRLHPQKGLIYLIEAVNIIKDKLNNTKFIIIGEGDEKKNLKVKIEELGVTDYFEFRGRKNGINLINEYYKADVFILPSLFEGFPLTLLEAGAAGLPPLVTKVGENNNIINNGYNGWCINPGDSIKLSLSIISLINTDKNELNIIGNNWLKGVKKEYDLKLINKTIFNNIKKKIGVKNIQKNIIIK